MLEERGQMSEVRPETEPSLSTPPGWGNDELSQFLRTAEENAWATFINLKAQYDLLLGIHRAYKKAVDNLHNTDNWFPILFLLHAHSAYLGAVRLAMSCQLPEAYRILRGCIESSLYGLHVHRNPASAEAWLKRHDDSAALQKAKTEFVIGPMFTLLESVDLKTAQAAKSLYEQTIDFGGHPNEKAIISNLKISREPGSVRFDLAYLNADSLALQLCLKTCARTGVASLRIFRQVFGTRFNLIGLSAEIDSLSKGL